MLARGPSAARYDDMSADDAERGPELFRLKATAAHGDGDGRDFKSRNDSRQNPTVTSGDVKGRCVVTTVVTMSHCKRPSALISRLFSKHQFAPTRSHV